jgi:hypothetical protein
MTKNDIVRTSSRAEGGITPEEKSRMDEHTKLWISRIMRTDPIEPDKIIPAIERLYEVSDLNKPRVVIVPSPLVMAFAYGASSAILNTRKNTKIDNTTRDATWNATRAATWNATWNATRDATDAATLAATRAATRDATRDATLAATRAATWNATDDATDAATRDATRAATDVATDVATYAATDDATFTATDDATRAATDVATLTATDVATRDATRAATDVATYAATRAATDVATDVATYAATRDAIDDATLAATRAATWNATWNATRDATRAATWNATRDATWNATDAATDAATRAATDDLEKDAAKACFSLAGEKGLKDAKNWYHVYQGGNMWGSIDCYLTAARDILGLKLPQHAEYEAWEQASIHGGFRVMHEDFCLVCDFPEILKVDAENRPHSENGPSHRWRDGWSLYHWHGVKIPAEWIENRESLTPQIALTWKNVEQRRAACEILGWVNILKALDAKIIDTDNDPEIGELVEVEIPEIGREKFLRVLCGTGRQFALPVPPEMTTALEAQAWTWGMDRDSFIKPEIRT